MDAADSALLDARPLRPGAPLVLDAPTLAQALGWDREPPLHPRLAETLTLLAQGLTDRQIAARLRTSEDGAKHRVRSLYRHLGVHSRSEAVYRAASLGLLDTARSPR